VMTLEYLATNFKRKFNDPMRQTRFSDQI